MKKVIHHNTTLVSLGLASLVFTLAVVPMLFMPTMALAWSGGGHEWATEAAVELFGSGPNHPEPHPMDIQRDREISLYPELAKEDVWCNPKEGWDPDEGQCVDGETESHENWEWLRLCSVYKDELDGDIGTMCHFWYAEEGLHENVEDFYDCNAWEEMLPHWYLALHQWQNGNLGAAYSNLGYAIHLIQDPAQPAHANEDMHPGDIPIPGLYDDDSLEEWMSGPYCRDNFKWDNDIFPAMYGRIIPPPRSNAEIIFDVMSASWHEADMHEEWVEDGMTVDSPFNEQQLFYIMYFINQIGGYFASDDQDGNTSDPTGWLRNFPTFPIYWPGFPPLDGLPGLLIQNDDGLIMNDLLDTDDFGHLSLIMDYAYGSAFRATPTIIDLFRRTVDNVPPVSTVSLKRVLDEKPVVLSPQCNNSPVTVSITGATDYPNPGWRESGVWKKWGRCNGVPPIISNTPEQTPYWSLHHDDTYYVEFLSTDYCGNVEGPENDLTIIIDMTPPVITFPDLRPNYLTSETLTALWTATDPGPSSCGIAEETAYLDGNLIGKGDNIDLSLEAGKHTLRVIVYDVAGNWSDVTYEFEVWIDADGWCFPVNIANKAKGGVMFCVIEFPTAYDVGLIDLATSELAVKGTLDLTQNDPIVGYTALLPTQLLTGVGDHDEDGIPDRMLQFDKVLFIDALAGQTGDIGSIISGGLLTIKQEHFIANVTVPVFSPPRGH